MLLKELNSSDKYMVLENKRSSLCMFTSQNWQVFNCGQIFLIFHFIIILAPGRMIIQFDTRHKRGGRKILLSQFNVEIYTRILNHQLT